MSDKPIHSEHRNRVRERFLKEGLDNFTDIQVLEMLLFYTIPRRDTNELAHALLDRFGSFAQVLEAPVEELARVEGIGAQSALFLSFVLQVGRYYQVNCARQAVILTTVDDCGKYLVPYFHGQRNEAVFLLCLDAKCKVLCCKKLGEGSVNSVGAPIRKIVEVALGANATSVVLAHNHPSGIAVPSPDDIQTTRRISSALSTMDIALVDHIVVADDDYVSMAQSGIRFDDGMFI